MFDENFSFLSSSSTTHYDAIVDISPFQSRSPSPGLQYTSPTSSTQYPPRRDSRFDTYRSNRQHSITTLTETLEHHHLSHNHTSPPQSPTASSPSSSSSTDADEGFFDGPETPSSTSDYSPDPEPYLWNLAMSDLPPTSTSSPRPSLSLEAQALSSYTMRRRQRQALVRLQCLVKRAPDLAMLMEECHPSSLPLSPDPVWTTSASRSNSTSSPSGVGSSGRVEKERSGSSCVRKPARMRKRATMK